MSRHYKVVLSAGNLATLQKQTVVWPRKGTRFPTSRNVESASNSRTRLIQRRSNVSPPRESLEGLSADDIEAKYGWDRQTVYNWLNRFEKRGFKAALFDKSRPGRPSELNDEQFERFTAVLHELPEKAGYDDPAWSSALA